MLYQLLAGGLVSFLNFGLHAIMTGLIVVVTRHVAGRTDDLHVFMRLSALLLVTMVTLMIAHVAEIAVWATFLKLKGIPVPTAGAFEFAFAVFFAQLKKVRHAASALEFCVFEIGRARNF